MYDAASVTKCDQSWWHGYKHSMLHCDGQTDKCDCVVRLLQFVTCSQSNQGGGLPRYVQFCDVTDVTLLMIVIMPALLVLNK